MKDTIDSLAARLSAAEADQSAILRPPPNFLDEDFPEQTAFIEDPADLKVQICPRRSGKSHGAGRWLFQGAHEIPKTNCLYLALTRDSVKRIMWKDVVKDLDTKLELGCKFNETELTATTPNGSIIYHMGMDSSEAERRKLLGQKYYRVYIDESAEFRIDLFHLVFAVLKPGVADWNGQICLGGVPSNIKSGLFYELTKDQDPQDPGRWKGLHGFSGHRWGALQNPYMRVNWQKAVDALKLANPRVEETPIYQQHYLGRWVTDDTKLVYRYLAGRNDFDGTLPTFSRGEWHYVLGVDLGYEDPTAFVVGAYHDHSKILYLLECDQASKLDISQVAARIKTLQKKYDFDKIIIDGSAKQAVAELENRHELKLTPADKRGKADFIEIMNGELISGFIKLGPGCDPLKQEWASLIWDERSDKREEHPGCANHQSDAALYLWRFCLPYLSEPIVVPLRGPKPLDLVEQELEDAARGRLRSSSEETLGSGNSENWEYFSQ